MKILVLAGESPVPATSGIRLRVLHLSRGLARAGEVTVGVLGEVGAGHDEPFAMVAAGSARSRLLSLVTAVRRPYDVAKHDAPGMHRLAAGGGWDVVQAELPYLLPAAGDAGAPVVLDAHNVESDVLRTLAEREPRRLRRTRLGWEARKTDRFERSGLRTVRAVAATSDEEAAAFERMGAREVVVVPNGVDASAIAFSPPGAGSRVVYAGHFGYRPNALAGLELATEVLPRLRERVPDAHVALIGRDPGPELQELAGEGVTVTGPVADVLPHLRAGRVTVVPLRAGGGTRLKVLEAMAAGVPVVSTPFGVAGLDIRDGETVLLGDTPAELAEAAERVIGDDALALRLATAARRLVERAYDWPVVVAPLLDLHLRLAGRA